MSTMTEGRMNTCLHLAIKNHHYNAVRWLVKHGADLDQCMVDVPRFNTITDFCFDNEQYNGTTPIAMLVAQKDAPLDLFDVLKTHENVNGSPQRNTALSLHVAAKHGHISIALHLIELGASVNQSNGRGDLPYDGRRWWDACKSFFLPLCYGRRLVQSLIKNGASVNQNDGNGCPPLHIAVENGHAQLAQSLIKHGALVNQEDADGDLPLHIAVQNGHTEIVHSLIEHGASVNRNSRNGLLPLQIACYNGHTELALSLIKLGASVKKKSENGILPLHWAAAGGHTELVHSLIEHGASVNQNCGNGLLPLQIACYNGHTELALSLIKLGVSVNQKSENGALPLQFAAAMGHTELAHSLITQGASVNQKDGGRNLPLHLAVSYDHTELALTLVNHGSCVNQEDGKRNLPLHLAVKQGNSELALSLEVIYDELLTSLIPCGSRNIIKTIYELLEIRPRDVKKDREVLSRMLHQLIQRLILLEPLAITLKTLEGFPDIYGECIECSNFDIYVYMQLNENVIVNTATSIKAVYLCSVLLVILKSDVCYSSSVAAELPSIASKGIKDQAQAIDDLWNAYKEKQRTVKKLQTLCIQKTRQSMRSLTDESFQSLQVPPLISKRVMLRDVADVLCEAYQMWPKCMSTEEVLQLSIG